MLADLILIAILIINLLIGLKRGFFIMIGRLVLLVLSLAVTLLLLSPLSGLLAKIKFLAPFAEKMSQQVLQPLKETASSIGAAIGSLKLPPFLASWMQSELPKPENSVTHAYPELTAVLYRFALNAVVFIVLFALVTLLIHLVARSLTKLSDSVPVIGAVNRIAGLVVGLALGLAEVSILLLVIGFLAPYLPSVAGLIEKSWIASYFYSINILYYLL
jgi:hypothetical protein